jgi:hypothetical protein
MSLALNLGSVFQVFIHILAEDGIRLPKMPKVMRCAMFGEGNEQNPGDIHSDYQAKVWSSSGPSIELPRWGISPLKASLLLSIVFGLTLLGLQIQGLVYISTFRAGTIRTKGSWCSPAFQMGDKVYDVGCHNYTVISPTGRIGCIEIPTIHHSSIEGTLVVGGFGVALELIEMLRILILRYTGGDSGKVRRPWLTISFGIGVWIWLLGVGLRRAKSLPILDHRVAILEQSGMGCQTQLLPGGVRGQIIGWSDGLFAKVNYSYFGAAGM